MLLTARMRSGAGLVVGVLRANCAVVLIAGRGLPYPLPLWERVPSRRAARRVRGLGPIEVNSGGLTLHPALLRAPSPARGEGAIPARSSFHLTYDDLSQDSVRLGQGWFFST